VTSNGLKPSEQLISRAVGAIVDLGSQRASVAEVARRAEIGKGMVTCPFRSTDDLILTVVAHILGSVKQHLEARLVPPSPARSSPTGRWRASWP
jgi:AcrR family transcriptional regulator